MDITFVEIIALTLAFVFAAAVVTKLRSPRAFLVALEGYRLLPGAVLPMAAGLVITAEIAAMVALISLVPGIQQVGLGLAAGLLALYGLAMAVNLARGRRDIDCGCAGPSRRTPISWAMVWRNATLAALALLPVFGGTGIRMLVAIDYVTIAGGVAAMLLAYGAMNIAIELPGRYRTAVRR